LIYYLALFILFLPLVLLIFPYFPIITSLWLYIIKWLLLNYKYYNIKLNFDFFKIVIYTFSANIIKFFFSLYIFS
jgi:hypothetical protein